MDNLEKLATIGTQDEDKQNNKHNTYVSETAICKQTHTQKRKKDKQLAAKTNRTSFQVMQKS